MYKRQAKYLRNIIAKEGAELVCLQETKLREFSDRRCISLWGDNKVGWVHNEGVNGVGSTLSMWHKEAFTYVSHTIGRGYIAIVGHHKSRTAHVLSLMFTLCAI